MLTGARQTGKTTLTRHLVSATQRTFRTLDDLRVLEQAEREPDLLVREAERLTLDEVQRAPDLLRAVKRAVDEDRRPGRFLLTGSANLLLLRTVSETLAGRAVYLRLGPLTEGEKARSTSAPVWSTLLAAETAEQGERLLRSRPSHPLTWQDAALRGGYPPVLPLSPDDRARWFDGYLATYLERDLQQPPVSRRWPTSDGSSRSPPCGSAASSIRPIWRATPGSAGRPRTATSVCSR